MAFFFGFFGVHRFYVGKFWTGLLLLMTGGGFGIWWIVDLILILLGRFTDAEGRILGPPQRRARLEEPPVERLGTDRDDREFDAAAGADGTILGSHDEEADFDDDELLEDPLKEEFEKLEQEMKERS